MVLVVDRANDSRLSSSAVLRSLSTMKGQHALFTILHVPRVGAWLCIQFIPYSFIAKEADHVEGFAPELALVTKGGGKVGRSLHAFQPPPLASAEACESLALPVIVLLGPICTRDGWKVFVSCFPKASYIPGSSLQRRTSFPTGYHFGATLDTPSAPGAKSRWVGS